MPRRWSSLTQVERVDLYTRQSLYLLLWGNVAVVLVGTSPEADAHLPAYVATCAGAAVLTVSATVVLRDVMALYPATGPVPWRSIGPFLALCGLAVAGVLVLPDDLRPGAGVVVWAALTWALGGLRHRLLLALLLTVLTLVPLLATGDAGRAVFALGIACFLVFTVRVSLWLLSVVTELDAARTAQGALAVAEERLRFSRDVHDVLGRQLSTIAVQAELASTLATRGDAGAADRMMEVREVAHQALREARELARGYRSTSLAQELEGARSLLAAAGITTRVDVDGLHPSWHEAAGWVVRETVTNVLRHSMARAVSISYADGVLEVHNDGTTAPAAESGSGSGLVGLRDRLAPLGASLEVRQGTGDFAVRARLPHPARQGVPA